MTKDHFIPRFIIRNFADSNGDIRIYNKETGLVPKKVYHYNQLQRQDFYSKKSLTELKTLFPDIEINPIFNSNLNDKLEDALQYCLEGPMSAIVTQIIEKFSRGAEITLSEKEKILVKEYIAIQHLRTLKFKRVSRAFNEKFSMPPEVKGQVIEKENNREIDIKAIIKRCDLSLNYKARRKLELKWRKKLKKNPHLVNEIRQELFSELLDEMIKSAEADIKDIITHPERHSAMIINKKQRDRFFKRAGIENKDVKIIANLTNTPFILGDTGIVIMADDPEGKNNLETFLPIHPNIAIGPSTTLPKNALIDDNFVADFNRITKEESYKNVYSTSEAALNC